MTATNLHGTSYLPYTKKGLRMQLLSKIKRIQPQLLADYSK